jgi:hypothetical protein
MSRITALLAIRHVPTRTRISLSILFGLVSGAVTLQSNILKAWQRDFAQVWFAARALLRGVDPYPLVGPGLELDWAWPLLYPLPAGVIAVPFAPFSQETASVLFSIIAGAAFAWALMEHGYATLFCFFGAPLHFAAETAQWSPLLSAALVVPAIGMLFVAKPTIGLAIFAARPSWWPIAGAVVFGGIAFVLQPHWVGSWLDAIARNDAAWFPHAPYRAPIAIPGGILALAALARWRRPEARLVAALACVPQTMMLYETVPLLLIPRSFRESALMVWLGYAVSYAIEGLLPVTRTAPEYLAVSGPLVVVGMYIPATLLVLSRPNSGDVPAPVERAASRLPSWLRGTRAAGRQEVTTPATGDLPQPNHRGSAEDHGEHSG